MRDAKEYEIHILQVTAWLMAIILSAGRIVTWAYPETLITIPNFFQILMTGILTIVCLYGIYKHL